MSNYSNNATIGGDLSCNDATIYSPIKTGYDTFPTFNTNSIGYSVSYVLAGAVALGKNISYIVPSTATTCTAQTTEANLCTLNVGVYIFLCDYQINAWNGTGGTTASLGFILKLNNIEILKRSDNVVATSNSINNGFANARMLSINVSSPNSTIKCSISTESTGGGENNLVGMDISFTKIA